MGLIAERLEAARERACAENDTESALAEAETVALQYLQAMADYDPLKMQTALAVALRLLRETGSPESAVKRMARWRRERLTDRRPLTEAELGALNVAKVIAGVGR